ncbi:YraN family protein [Candidatus Azambacteria bacterium]|nr:YraN family protein [Candidatus Azambacteria bacterium]
MITQRRATGNTGEEKAAEYLISEGYSIIERNFNTKFGEIDVVARSPGGDIVFVEVKSVKKGSYIAPEENITFHKLRKFARTVEMFLFVRKISPEQKWQMDSISAVFDDVSGEAEIRHIENINIH